MTFALLAAVSAFATFTIVDAAASAMIAALFRRADGLLDRYSPASRSAVLFRLRIAPAAIAAVAGFGVALPIFIVFEPFDTDEPISRTLVTLAVLGGIVLARGLWRALSAWRATARVSRDWQRRGRRVDLAADVTHGMPVIAVDAAFPTVAVVGMWRPVLFVAERVLAECPAEEVHAMIAHECAHVRARDNLKRFVMRACPDLMSPRGAVTRAWTSATEEAADAAAVGLRPGSALDLAQALIHVARLAPATVPELASSFYPGGDIERRVRRLVDPPADRAVPIVLLRTTLAAMTAILAVLAVLGAPALHQAMEIAVRLLP